MRLAGLDAPEWDQKAKHQDGYWFKHGKRVKDALIQEIGGKRVHVSVESVDKFGRLLGTVTYNGRDIGEWLVREGHAVAAYSDRYKHVERRRAQRSAACGRTPITLIPEPTGIGIRQRIEVGYFRRYPGADFTPSRRRLLICPATRTNHGVLNRLPRSPGATKTQVYVLLRVG